TILFFQIELVNSLAWEKLRVAGIDNFPLFEHLTNDDLNVLIVDANCLALVDVLDLRHQVLLDSAESLELQHPLWIQWAFREAGTGFDGLANPYIETSPLGH